MKNYFLTFTVVLLSLGLRSQNLILHFGFNSDQLTNASMATLDRYANDLKNCDSILLVGHTDTVGSPAFNLQLSQRRAENVQNWMLKNAISTRTTIQFSGEEKVLDPNNDSLNRRVELFAFYHTLEPPKKEVQEFTIDNSKDTTFYGKEGTLIKIQSNSIVPKSPTNTYKISLREFYSDADMIYNHLETRTESELLETAGMIKLEINDKGKSYSLTKTAQIGFPVRSSKNKDMKLFTGFENKHGNINWKLQDTTNIRLRDEVFFVVEEMPKYVDGKAKSFEEFINLHTRYPLMARDSGYCGTVYVRFVVTTDGSLADIGIARGSHPILNAEALRVVNLSEKWIPGKQQGQNVPVWMTYPFRFQMSGGCKEIIDSSFKYKGTYSTLNDSIYKNSTIGQLDYYMFKTFNFGSYNCDAYKRWQTASQTIIADGIGDISTYVLMTTSSIMLRGLKQNNHFVFDILPKNATLIAIAIKKIGGKVYLAKKKAVVSSQPIVLDDFKEIKFEDLNKEISEVRNEK